VTRSMPVIMDMPNHSSVICSGWQSRTCFIVSCSHFITIMGPVRLSLRVGCITTISQRESYCHRASPRVSTVSMMVILYKPMSCGLQLVHQVELKERRLLVHVSILSKTDYDILFITMPQLHQSNITTPLIHRHSVNL
jgi:hypothetical protein